MELDTCPDLLPGVWPGLSWLPHLRKGGPCLASSLNGEGGCTPEGLVAVLTPDELSPVPCKGREAGWHGHTGVTPVLQ